MLFSKKLDILFERYELTHTEVARAAKLDASLISRFRTGARVPTRRSAQLEKLANGIVMTAGEGEKRARLYKSFDVEDGKRAELQTAIVEWFSAADSHLKPPRGENTPSRSGGARKKHAELHEFSEKMDALMKALDLSNIRLARNLNVDASLISRFRTGVRRPMSDSQLLYDMCTYFVSASHAVQQRVKVCAAVGLPLIEEDGKLHTEILKWLVETDDISSDSPVDSLLEQFENIPQFTQNPSLESDSQISRLSKSRYNENYIGLRGMREMISRFLSEAAFLDEPCTLMWFSDQPIEWLMGDPSSVRIWKQLLFSLFERGFKLELVLDFGRSEHEILHGIEEWLGILLSGNVNSFICDSGSETRFVRSIFIAGGNYCATGDCMATLLDKAIYSFSNSADLIDYMTLQFNEVKRLSAPLIEVYARETASEYMEKFAELAIVEAESRSIMPSLPLCTMPVELLRSILERDGISDEESFKCLSFLDNYRRAWQERILSYAAIECCALPSDEDLFSGKAAVAVPPMMLNRTIYYTPADFSAHCEATVDMLKKYGNFTLNILPQTPFKNISILTKRGGEVLCARVSRPKIGMILKHPTMSTAFFNYIERVRKTGIELNRTDGDYDILQSYIDV